jgi:hypothetical protein
MTLNRVKSIAIGISVVLGVNLAVYLFIPQPYSLITTPIVVYWCLYLPESNFRFRAVYFMGSGSRFKGVLLPLELGYITNYFT